MQTVTHANLDQALDYVRAGRARLVLATYTHITLISKRSLASFEADGGWMIRREDSGFRMKSGKGSVYVLPGYLKLQAI